MGMKKRAEDKGIKATEGVRQAPRGDSAATEIFVPSSAPAAPAGPIVIDSNHSHVAAVAGASRKDVKEYSTTDEAVVDGLHKSIDNAARIAKIMEKRNREGGRTVYACPFCKSVHEGKTPAAAKKACAAHIKSEHAMAVQAAKLEKQPKEKYEPKERLIPPVVNPADFVAPEHKRFFSHTDEIRETTRTIRERAVSLRTGRLGGHFNVDQYMIQTEQGCIRGLPKLSLDQLQSVARTAENKGKRLLVRAARKAIAARTQESAA